VASRITLPAMSNKERTIIVMMIQSGVVFGKLNKKMNNTAIPSIGSPATKSTRTLVLLKRSL
jgi:hypothetical protein